MANTAGSVTPGAAAATVQLNVADRSLDCQLVDSNIVSTYSDEGFGYLWSGVRATHGILGGRFWFSVRVMDTLDTTVPNIGYSGDCYEEDQARASTIHCCRVGVSKLVVDVSSLGSYSSWGYGSTGKKSTANMFNVYPYNAQHPSGRQFGPGDEVACFVDFEAAPGTASISFAVNCDQLGPAFQVFQPPALPLVKPASQLHNLHQAVDTSRALFPHVLIKNLAVSVNLTGERPLHWPADKEWTGEWCHCLPWQASLVMQVAQPSRPLSVAGPCLPAFQECQVVMMVGLPGAGKTHQAQKLMASHGKQHGSCTLVHGGSATAGPAAGPARASPQQQQPHYLLLSLESVLKQMKVSGLRRGGAAAAARTSELLWQAEEVFRRLLLLAAEHPGNYIIDCCNVQYEQRRQRLALFRAAGFKLVAAVVLEPEAVLDKRLQQRNTSLYTPCLDDLLDMQASFSLPEVSHDEFDEVRFLGSISTAAHAAQLVAAQQASAKAQQLQLKLQQDAFSEQLSAAGTDGLQLSPTASNSSSTTTITTGGFPPYNPADFSHQPATGKPHTLTTTSCSQYALPYGAIRRGSPSLSGGSSTAAGADAGAGAGGSSVYVRQPWWFGPQQNSTRAVQQQTNQQPALQQQQQHRAQQLCPGAGTWGASLNGAASLAAAATSSSGHQAAAAPAPFNDNGTCTAWPALSPAAPTADSLKMTPGKQPPPKSPFAAAAQQQQQQQLPADAHSFPHPFVAVQANGDGLVGQLRQPFSAGASGSTSASTAAQAGKPNTLGPCTPTQTGNSKGQALCEQQQQQRAAQQGTPALRQASSLLTASKQQAHEESIHAAAAPDVVVAGQLDQNWSLATARTSDSFATTDGEVSAVEISPQLQRQLNEQQFISYSSGSLDAAISGCGPSKKRPRKLGEGSYGVVYGCRRHDLQRSSSSGMGSSMECGRLSSMEGAASSAGCSSSMDGGAAAGASGPEGLSPVPSRCISDSSAADVVAVKVLSTKHCTAADFVRELEVLACCSHEHLVALQGYCLSKRALVFEYCAAGSLEDWLSGRASITRNRSLTWQQRLDVALQVAQALHYLHTRQPEPVIHRDVKPNNILLAADLSVRLADVGLSRFLPVNLTSVHSSTQGCFYYMPDEYNLYNVVSAALDVFSYGLVLGQMLTGKVQLRPRMVLSTLEVEMEDWAPALDKAKTVLAEAAAPGRRRRAGHAAAAAAAVAAAAAANKSCWWLGVLANCRGTNSSGSSSSVGARDHQDHAAAAVTCMTNVPNGKQQPLQQQQQQQHGSNGAQAAGAARPQHAVSPRHKSWAAVASTSSGRPAARAFAAAINAAGIGATSRNGAAAEGKSAAVGRAGGQVGSAAPAASCGHHAGHGQGQQQQQQQQRSVGQAVPAVSAATTVPTGLRQLLDETAGEWPPRVAVGLAMLAMACTEPDRRQRPSAAEVVEALQQLQEQMNQQQQQQHQQQAS